MRVVGDATGPPRGRAVRRARERPRRRGQVVVGALTVLVVAGAAVTGVVLVSRELGTSSSTPSPSEPLLPGAPTVTAPPEAPPVRIAGVGYDISYPQCRSALPSGAAFGIVGVNGGAPLTSNKCFATQFAWAARTRGHAVYVNTSYSGKGDPIAYGRNLIEDAIAREHAAGVSHTAVWWLDVEVGNTWAGTQQENATVLATMASTLQRAGVRVGIYSSPQQWAEIAGEWAPGLPVWNATGPGTQKSALPACSESFAGSTSAIVQWVQKSGNRLLDHNVICPAWQRRAGELLDVATR